MNAPAGSNPGGGVAWADIRKENGHAEPYNVRYFEIGNENNQPGTDGTTSQQYWMIGTQDAEKAYVEGGVASFTKQYAVKKMTGIRQHLSVTELQIRFVTCVMQTRIR